MMHMKSGAHHWLRRMNYLDYCMFYYNKHALYNNTVIPLRITMESFGHLSIFNVGAFRKYTLRPRRNERTIS